MALIRSKFDGYTRDGVRVYPILSMGGGSSSTEVKLTPEQQETLSIQNEALKNTFLPAYQQTVGTAGNVLEALTPFATGAAQNAYGLAGDVSRSGVQAGTEAYQAGFGILGQLFDPNYEKGQVQAALQAGREDIREQFGQQNAMYGAAGGLGSARQALAQENLSQLGAQRQATAAAGAQAQVQQNRMAAAGQVLGAGQNLISTGLGAANQQISASQSPMDLYSKYASVVFGTPQASTAPNYAGTQGQKSSSFGFGF